MSKNQVIVKGEVVPMLPKDIKYYDTKITLLFGGSGTGKSVILNEIMYLLHEHISNVIAVCPTNIANGFYAKKVPPKCIKSGSDPAKVIALLRNIITRQRYVAELYNKANNIEILLSIFDLLRDRNEAAARIESNIMRLSEAKIAQIKENGGLSPLDKRNEEQAVKDKRDPMLVQLYRSVIRVNIDTLVKYRNKLTDNQWAAIVFLDINPKLLLILDDCASKFKEWNKKKGGGVLNELFYEGRQWYITLVITVQDDKAIDSELRKNSMVNIFTTEQIATSNFTRPSNSYPKYIIEQSKAYIPAVFEQVQGAPKNFRKLVYIRDLQKPFSYTVASLYDNFKIGSTYLWELSRKMSRSEQESISNNVILRRYKNGGAAHHESPKK